MYVMPKRPRFIHPVRQVRTCLAHTQASFAKLLGCAAITIQRIENGPLRLSEKLANTILETTGANPTALLKGKALDRDGKPFTKESSEKYKALVSCVDSRQHHRQTLFSWIELLLIASERAGQSKMDAVVANIQIFLKKLAADFNLDKNIKGFLVEHGSVRKRSYRVSDLRKFPAYAKIIGYTDNKRFKPEKILAFEILTGWIHDFAALDECPVLPKDLEKNIGEKSALLVLTGHFPKKYRRIFQRRSIGKFVNLSSRGDQKRIRFSRGMCRRPEINPLRLPLRMFVRQMPINLADQNTAVLMAHPLGNRHEINAGHDTHRNKEMSAVVKSE